MLFINSNRVNKNQQDVYASANAMDRYHGSTTALCQNLGPTKAPALILVHGYPDNQEVWEPVIAVLVQDFFVVSYDVRGAGQSSIPKSIRVYSLAQLAAGFKGCC